jgi:hypothetical protein
MDTNGPIKKPAPQQERTDPLLVLDPPSPRAPGPRPPVTERATGEDTVVDEIAAENSKDALDDLYEHDREHESPMLIIGDEKRRWYHIFKRPSFWLSFIALVIAAFAFVWLITPSRLWLLNTVGLRAQVNIATVVSAAQGTPPLLKNALVTINGQEYRTDDSGELRLTLPYGPVQVVVSKPGYETITKDYTVDFDPFFYYLGGKQTDQALLNQTFIMKSVGLEVKFIAKDWLTGLPITVGNYGIGDVVTTPDAKGEVTLTIPATDATTVQVVAKFGGRGYADTTLAIPLSPITQELTFVPAGKHYFISKRSGQLAVYSSNIDGSAVTEAVPSAAAETADMAFSVSPTGKYAALASTREATRDTFGSVQQKMYIVDLATNKLTPLDTALRFDIVDWSGDSVVYTAAFRNSGGAVVERLASIDATKAQHMALATDPDFLAVRVRLASVVYLRADKELRTIKVAGGTEKTLGTGVQKLTQSDANKFAYQIADKSWRQYDVNADQVTTIATPSAQNRSFLASTSADNQTLLVVEPVDGTLTLIAKAVGNGAETKLFANAELTGPVRWVGNVAVYRAGSADYAIGSGGGTAKKITDVTQTQTASDDYFDFN